MGGGGGGCDGRLFGGFEGGGGGGTRCDTVRVGGGDGGPLANFPLRTWRSS